ncbi:hypothetical protein K432DRAFT_325124 [Lepidopterella palustris CBS 459.81]|uniref:Uncharacterized protein n=1 Tax=Lepidopterella palustris CBS 459.81 TaxID=1314670 RepID=A0A8E2EDL0_9PEZI|nr:hypothetical protein K432DRAFT_325124 [Lepidopterella palustris CBS 459.81]
MPPNKLLLATAVAHGLLSIGHTMKGIEMFANPSFKKLPPTLFGAVKAGWFEGSVFLAIMGLINYRWANEGFKNTFDIAIASLISVLCFGFGGYYAKTGDKGTAGILSVVGLLQVAGARGAM